jgi:very-short-patch-repair endonuclease
MRGKRAIDLAIPILAANQHGVVTRAQLRLCGLHDRSIDRRITGGRLHPIHRGVYAVGHTVLTVQGRWMAAVLAGGPDAVLSHASAAAAWELRAIGGGRMHVTVPSHGGRTRRGDIRLHRTITLTPEETATHRGIPITTVERTIADLAALLDARALERLLDHAEMLRLVDFADLRIEPGRRGAPALRAALAHYEGPTLTRSELEKRFLDLCDEHRLPQPMANTRIEGIEVDFAWPDARLIVEVDGYGYHRSPSAFESDRERDVTLAIAGWQVLRFTWAQVSRRPAWVARAVVKRLALSRRYAE